jgi:hypothetical protein
MSWNYRIIELDQSSRGERWLEIREVFYNEDGTVRDYSTTEAGVVGHDPDELRSVHAMLAEAFDNPILLESQLPQGEPGRDA